MAKKIRWSGVSWRITLLIYCISFSRPTGLPFGNYFFVSCESFFSACGHIDYFNRTIVPITTTHDSLLTYNQFWLLAVRNLLFVLFCYRKTVPHNLVAHRDEFRSLLLWHYATKSLLICPSDRLLFEQTFFGMLYAHFTLAKISSLHKEPRLDCSCRRWVSDPRRN